MGSVTTGLGWETGALGWFFGLCRWAMGLCFSELGADGGLLISAVEEKGKRIRNKKNENTASTFNLYLTR